MANDIVKKLSQVPNYEPDFGMATTPDLGITKDYMAYRGDPMGDARGVFGAVGRAGLDMAKSALIDAPRTIHENIIDPISRIGEEGHPWMPPDDPQARYEWIKKLPGKAWETATAAMDIPDPTDIAYGLLRYGGKKLKGYLQKNPELLMKMTEGQWKEGLGLLKRSYKRAYSKGWLDKQTYLDSRRAIKTVEKEVPVHLREKFDLLWPNASDLKAGEIGRFTEKSRFGKVVGELRFKHTPGMKAETIGHEVGHGIQAFFREMVGNKAIEEGPSKGMYQRIYPHLVEMRDITLKGREQYYKLKETMGNLYVEGVLDDKQVSSIAKKLVSWYHNVPTEEMLVEQMGRRVADGIPLKDAFKISMKEAVKAYPGQRKIVGKMEELNSVWRSMARERGHSKYQIRKADELVADLRGIIESEFMYNRSYQMDDLIKTSMKAGVQGDELQQLVNAWDALDDDALHKIWKKYSNIELPGRPITGRYEKVGDKIKWVEGDSSVRATRSGVEEMMAQSPKMKELPVPEKMKKMAQDINARMMKKGPVFPSSMGATQRSKAAAERIGESLNPRLAHLRVRYSGYQPGIGHQFYDFVTGKNFYSKGLLEEEVERAVNKIR